MADVTPTVPAQCEYCETRFRWWKPPLGAGLSSALGLLVITLVVYTAVQLGLGLFGFYYASPSYDFLFVGVPSGLRCGECGSGEVSHSIEQPLERAVALFNPLAPYRCWDCRHRFWIPWPLWRVARGLALIGVVLVLILRAHRGYRSKVREMEGLLAADDLGQRPPA